MIGNIYVKTDYLSSMFLGITDTNLYNDYKIPIPFEMIQDILAYVKQAKK